MNNFFRKFFETILLSILISECNGDIYFDQPVKYGQATYYSGGLGSCGRVSTGYQVAAITVRYMGNPPKGNPNLAPLCAPQYCILVTGPEGSIVVKVSDTLGSGMGEDNIDLYDDVYTNVATKVLGRTIVAWRFVSCASNPLGTTTKQVTSVISGPSVTGSNLTAGIVSGGSISAGLISAVAVSGGAVAANIIQSPPQAPTSSGEAFSCTQDGTFPAPGCTGFYQCINTNTPSAKKVLHTCPSGTLFDNTVSNCNTPSLVKCGSSSAPATSNKAKAPVATVAPRTILASAASNSIQASPKAFGSSFSCTQDGTFPAPGCTGFYQCMHTNTPFANKVLHACPSGTLFDSTISNCNTPSLVNCESTIDPPDSSQSGFLTAGSLAVNSLIPSSVSVSAGSVQGLILKQSDDLEFVCPHDGYFALPPTCHSYVQCAHTNTPFAIRVLQTCPQNLLFDQKISNCNTPSLVQCGSVASQHVSSEDKEAVAKHNNVLPPQSSSTPGKAFICTQDGMFASSDCKGFYQCINTNTPFSQKSLHLCPPGTLFDSTISNCNTPSLVNCNTLVATHPIKPSETLAQSGFLTAGSLAVNSLIPNSVSVLAGSVQGLILKPSDNLQFECPHDGYFALPPTCHSYVQCANSKTPFAIRVLQTCPENLIFDKTISSCNYPNLVTCS